MTASGHLLDNNDVGSFWKDQNERLFIVGKIDGEDIYLLPVLTKDDNNDVYSASWNGSLQYPAELTHVSGAMHTDMISGSSTRYDLVIQSSQNRHYFADGVEILNNGEYYCDEFVIKEHIIGHNVGKVQNWFPTPQYDGSLIDWDRCFIFKGSSVACNMVINTQYPFALTDYRGCIPQMPLQVGDYHSFTFIPKVKKQINGHRVDMPFNSDDGTIGSNHVSVVRNSSDLYNVNDQPERCISYLKDNNGRYLVGMAGGGSLVRGISKKENRNIFVPVGQNSCTYGGDKTPNKFYPKMLQAAGFESGIVPSNFVEEFCCYYSWFDPNANEGQVYWYKDDKNYVIYAHCQKEQQVHSVNVPHFLERQALKIIEKTDNTELLSGTVQDSKFYVNYNTSEANYIVVSIPINKYRLTYMVDGEVYKMFDLENCTTITPEQVPSKEGYTFSGWSDIPLTMPAQDVTVTGSFTINKYRLIYMLDGSEYKSQEVEYGAAITPEPAPAKEGYTFSGWSEIPATMPANDVVIEGAFSVNKYKLVYMVDGVEYKTYEVELGGNITPEAPPTKEGYTFSGWSEIPSTMPAQDVTVTGNFTINKYRLVYMLDGSEYKSLEVEYGATITPEPAPTKEGYTFSGWSDIPATMPARDVVIEGAFSINKYKLVYMVDGAEYKTYEVELGGNITPEASPTKEGYTFSGWSDIPSTMPSEDVTVTGNFTINKYRLVYMLDGIEYKSLEVEYGATITPETAPTKEGYTFSGWSEIPATMPANDVTITGSFKETVGINIIIIDSPGARIYDMLGNRIDQVKIGVNIIRMDDGKAKKVLVKKSGKAER